jgi:phosphoglycerol geranylgeranyltransferase
VKNGLMSKTLMQLLVESKNEGRKQLGILLDPDKTDIKNVDTLVQTIEKAGADIILVGGSLLTSNHFNEMIASIKRFTTLPVVLFPSSIYQISKDADAIMFLSLISGRNPELLIGKHVEAAPILKHINIEVIPTGYMLIDGGKPTTASYVSNTLPIPANKPEIAACTALAGQFLGLQLIYLDAGSGASTPVSKAMISSVKNIIHIPLIVGGGINSPEMAYDAALAGADLVVVGNTFEEDQSLIPAFVTAIKSAEKIIKNTISNA